VKEKQESELLNNADYGLLNNAADAQKIKTRKGAPTPDDLDEPLTKVWKEPSLFLAHPRPSTCSERRFSPGAESR
jgi:Phage capsid-like protein